MDIIALLLLLTWTVVIPLLLLFPPKVAIIGKLRQKLSDRKQRQLLRNALLDQAWCVNEEEEGKQEKEEKQEKQRDEEQNNEKASQQNKSKKNANSPNNNKKPEEQEQQEREKKQLALSNKISKWIVPADRNLILVFFNPRSGGGLGRECGNLFRQVLTANQVFDVTQKDLDIVSLLKSINNDNNNNNNNTNIIKNNNNNNNKFNVRIVCAGGDGTVASLAKCVSDAKKDFPIAPMALGTGCDAAHETNFGSGVTESQLDRDFISKFSVKVLQATIRPMDVWRVQITPLEQKKPLEEEKQQQESSSTTSSSSSSVTSSATGNTKKMKQTGGGGGISIVEEEKKEYARETRKQEFELESLLYMSFGIDAQICKRFHEEREKSPLNSQAANIARYAMLGFEASFSSKPLGDKVKDLRGTGGRKIDKFLPDFKCLVISNARYYQGGKDFWGSASVDEHDDLKPASSSDKLLEVHCLAGTTHFSIVHVGLDSSIRLGQESEVTMTLPEEQLCQVDGEPLLVPPSTIRISHKRQQNMLQCPKKDSLW